MALLVDTQTTLNKEFSMPKSKSQLVVGFKEIMIRLGEIPSELDQRIKYQIHEVNMNLTYGQHHE